MVNCRNQIEKIYDLIYLEAYNDFTYIFLCGGSQKDNIRDKVRYELNKYRFRILYPEDLFNEILTHNKNENLLFLETFLADNSDVICIICESWGSAVELGAFSQYEKTKDKIVVALHKKYSRAHSFIMLGPIKMLRLNNPYSVIFYQNDKYVELAENVKKAVFRIRRVNISSTRYFTKLSTFISFIPLVLYFVKKITNNELYDTLKDFTNRRDIGNSDFDYLYKAAIKYLLKIGHINPRKIREEDYNDEYLLTNKGLKDIGRFLSNLKIKNKDILYDKIRLDIMDKQYKKGCPS